MPISDRQSVVCSEIRREFSEFGWSDPIPTGLAASQLPDDIAVEVSAGSLGMSGATGTLLLHALTELLALSEQPLVEGDKDESAASQRYTSKPNQLM